VAAVLVKDLMLTIGVVLVAVAVQVMLEEPLPEQQPIHKVPSEVEQPM
jgi:hypothetical protein